MVVAFMMAQLAPRTRPNRRALPSVTFVVSFLDVKSSYLFPRSAVRVVVADVFVRESVTRLCSI